MSNLDLPAIKARYEAATEGPWTGEDNYVRGDHGVLAMCPCYGPGYLAEFPAAANAEFIAHARTDVPELVAEVERLRKTTFDLLDAWRLYEESSSDGKVWLESILTIVKVEAASFVGQGG